VPPSSSSSPVGAGAGSLRSVGGNGGRGGKREGGSTRGRGRSELGAGARFCPRALAGSKHGAAQAAASGLAEQLWSRDAVSMISVTCSTASFFFPSPSEGCATFEAQ
jgi:hypothetical protein